MIKVNLLKTKKSKSITIPFGWIFVALIALGCAVGLYVANETFLQKIATKEQELEAIQRLVRDLKKYDTQKKQQIETERTVTNEYNRYEQVLSTKSGGWTGTLILFEELLRKAGTVWMRDLRIDGDGRVTLNGVSMGRPKDKARMPGITTLFDDIEQRRTKFKSVRLKRIQKTQEQRQDVSQFELTCVLIR
jgi:hypothetical protein